MQYKYTGYYLSVMIQPLSDKAIFVLSPTRYPQGSNSGMSTPAMHSLLISVNNCHTVNNYNYTRYNFVQCRQTQTGKQLRVWRRNLACALLDTSRWE